MYNDDRPLDLSKTRDEQINDRPLDLSLKPKALAAENTNVHKKLVRGQDEWLNKRKNNFISQILKCLECSKSFGSLVELSSHMRKTKHFKRPYRKTTFRLDNRMRMHKKAIKTSSNNMLTKNSTTDKSNNLLCLICSKRFTSGMSLIEHLQNSHTINQICTSCGAYFETNYEYQKHVAKENHHHHHHHHQTRNNVKTNFTKCASSTPYLAQSKEKITNCIGRNQHLGQANDTCNYDKNPLLALEMLVGSEVPVNPQQAQTANKCVESRSRSPLSLLKQMHSSINNYVFKL
jgi:hypothetical protein